MLEFWTFAKQKTHHSWFKMKNACAKCIRSTGNPSPTSVYLGRHWRHSHDKMEQAFPLHFLHIAREQKLDNGKSWEQHYRRAIYSCVCAWSRGRSKVRCRGTSAATPLNRRWFLEPATMRGWPTQAPHSCLHLSASASNGVAVFVLLLWVQRYCWVEDDSWR